MIDPLNEQNGGNEGALDSLKQLMGSQDGGKKRSRKVKKSSKVKKSRKSKKAKKAKKSRKSKRVRRGRRGGLLPPAVMNAVVPAALAVAAHKYKGNKTLRDFARRR
jgi:hypothetical protein